MTPTLTRLAALAAALICCLALPAQNTFEDMKPTCNQWGGLTVSIAVNPMNGNEFLAMTDGGLYRSTDGGNRWWRLETWPGVMGIGVEFCPQNPDIILASGTYDTKVKRHLGLWRSTDHGATWDAVDGNLYPPSDRCPEQCGSNGITWVPGSNTVYVATDCGLLKSTDNGASWRPDEVDPSGSGGSDPRDARTRPDRLFAVMCMDEEHVLVAGEGGVYLKQPGNTWGMLRNAPPSFYCTHAFSYAPQDHNILFRADYNCRWLKYSTNMGITWQDMCPAGRLFIEENTSYRFGVAWSPEPYLLYQTTPTSPTIMRTDLYNLSTGNQPPFTCTTLSAQGPDFFDLYFSNGTLLLKTTLNKKPTEWGTPVFHVVGLPHPDPLDMCADPITGLPSLVSGDWGVAKTSDMGASWYAVGGGAGGLNALAVAGLEGIWADDATEYVDFVTWHNNAWVSTDECRTWMQRSPPAEGTYILSNAPVRGSTSTGKVSIQEKGVPYVTGYNLAAGPASFMPPRNGNWARSISFYHDPRTDKDMTFVLTLSPANIITYDVMPSDGTAWTNTFSANTTVHPTPASYVMFANQGMEVKGFYVDVRNNLWRVDNVNGAVVSAPVMVPGIANIPLAWNVNGHGLFAVKPDNPSCIVAFDKNRGVMRTTNGGSSWEELYGLNRLITRNGDVYMYIDNNRMQVYEIAFNPHRPHEVLVGTYENGLFISYDSGETWSALDRSARVQRVSEVDFSSDHSVWVGSSGMGLWKYSYRFILRLPPPTYFPPCDNCIRAPGTGTILPIGIITDPEHCPACTWVLAREGEIVGAHVDPQTRQTLIQATHPESLLLHQEEESQAVIVVQQGQAKPQQKSVPKPTGEPKRSKCPLVRLFQKRQTDDPVKDPDPSSQAPLVGLVLSHGEPYAEIRNEGGQWVITDKFVEQCYRGEPGVGKEFQAPMLKQSMDPAERLPVSKAVLENVPEQGMRLPSGETLQLKGSGFRSPKVLSKGEVLFYIDGIQLEEIGHPDEAGDLQVELFVPLPPGTYTLHAVFEGYGGWERSSCRLVIDNHDGEEQLGK